MFGYPVSFHQFLVLCFILYLLFGDPAFSWWLFKRRREDRLRARGFLKPLPVHPLLEIIDDLEYNLKQDIFSFKHFLERSASLTSKSDIERRIIFDSDFKSLVSLEQRLMQDYYIVSDGILDITLKIDRQLMTNFRISSKFWSHTLSTLRYLNTYQITMHKLAEILFNREVQYRIIQIRILQFLDQILQIQEDFRREHAEFIFEKDRVMRQLDLYNQHFHAYASKLKSRSKSKSKSKSKSRIGPIRHFRNKRRCN